MRAVSVRRKALADIESGSTTCYHVEQPRSSNGTDQLSDYIRRDLSGGETAACSETHRHGWIKMTSGDMTYCIGHCYDAQPKCQGYAEQTDADLRKRRCNNRAAASRKCQ